MSPRVALVHDWLTSFGGAERVLAVLADLFPDAPIYTLVHDPENLPQFSSRQVHTSFLQKIPFAKKKYRMLLPLMPTAIEQFDLSAYDVVISSSHAVAKGIITPPQTRHICYCHTPMRYAWDLYHFYQKHPQFGGKITSTLMPWLLHHIRLWDQISANRVDTFLANSANVAGRIHKYYRRDSTVVYPPVAVATHQPRGLAKEDFFLVLSRLIPQKHVEIAVTACTQLRQKLVVIGDGSERKHLESIAGKTITFLGFQPDEVVRDYLEQACAFIFPAEDDFGMTPVEAMALGTPVIALQKGGALETVIPGKTGEFFSEATAESAAEVIETFEQKRYNQSAIRKHALRFDEAIFRQQIEDIVNNHRA